MYDRGMNDHDYPQYNSHEASITALLDEMPPEDFDIDYSGGEEFSIAGYLVTVAMVASVMFIMFKFL